MTLEERLALADRLDGFCKTLSPDEFDTYEIVEPMAFALLSDELPPAVIDAELGAAMASLPDHLDHHLAALKEIRASLPPFNPDNLL